VAFGGTRTYHRMACAIEDAGFEIRDSLMWVYGCLDDQTMAVTSSGVMPYHKIKKGDLVLSYDPSYMTYEWQPVEEVLVYDVDDTAYRISTDFGDQLVSRNHRCIVERGGEEVFEFAENAARQHEIRVPVLEDLRALLDAFPSAHEGAGGTKQDVLAGLHEGDSVGSAGSNSEARGNARGKNAGHMQGVRDGVLAQHETPDEGVSASMQLRVQRSSSRGGVEGARAYRAGELVTGVGIGAGGAHDGRDESCVEGWRDLSESEGQLRVGSVRTLPGRVHADVAQGRVRDGASSECGDGDGSSSGADGVRASHRPRPAEQHADKPDALRNEQGPQAVRAWRGHKTVVGRITPERYRGVIWCVRVKNGAFVAVRNGFAFPTGNSGFPKSHNQHGDWEGWGTALKPAWEPIALARKPLTGTVAANLAEWGVGALNIDGCRVPHSGERLSGGGTQTDHEGWGRSLCGRTDSAHAEQLGRWPANVCHDGSDDVVAAFPNTAASKAAKDNKPMQRQDNNVYGKGLGSISPNNTYSDNGGSAARFFYSAKASKADRNGSKHPTVKPISLMQWLCRLITPPGGAILDPFAGSGTTGAAARLEGFRAILIEREAEYQQDIRHRFAESHDLLEAAE